MEAWNWLEREGLLIHDPQQPADWFTISRQGEAVLGRYGRFEHLEKLALDRVKHDLLNGGFRWVGGTLEQQEQAWEWVRMKEGQTTLPAGKRAGASGMPLIADSRIDWVWQPPPPVQLGVDLGDHKLDVFVVWAVGVPAQHAT